MQDDGEDLIKLGENSRIIGSISTVASQYLLVDVPNESGSHDIFEPDEGRALTREAGELRIKGVEFNNQALDKIIYRVLEKVKSQHVSQERIIHLFCRILTFTSEYLHDEMNAKEANKFEQEVVDKVDIGDKEILSAEDKRKFCKLIDMVEKNVKNNYEIIQSDKIDDFVRKIMNEETKKFISDEFYSENLDYLIIKLFEDIMKLDENSVIDHEKFNDFIDSILGKETKEYIVDKLKAFTAVKQNITDYKNNL